MRLGRLGRSSLIYVVGDLLAKGSRFLLIPIYVRYLTQEEVGLLAILHSITAVLALFFSLALGSAAMRYYIDYTDEHQADRYVAALWWTALLFSGAFCGLIVLGIAAIRPVIFSGISPFLLILAVLAAWLASSFNLPLARYVVREEPLKHRLFSLLQFLSTAMVVVYFVVFKKMGIEGVLFGQVGTYAAWCGVAGVLVTYPAGFHSTWVRIRESVKYSLPIVPHKLFEWALSLSDRLILEWFIPIAAIGVYSVGYQLGAMLLIASTAMNRAWMPQFYKTAETADGATDYARVATYFMGTVFVGALGLAFLAPEMLAVIAPNYGGAVVIMQVVTFGYVFHALYLVFSGPLFYLHQTKWIPVITGAAAIGNIVIILLLTPIFGAVGGAIGTVAGYVTMSVAAYIISRRSYNIAYEVSRILIVAGVTLAFAAVVGLMPSDVSWGVFGLKLVILAVYLSALFFVPGFLTHTERSLLIRNTRRAVARAGALFS